MLWILRLRAHHQRDGPAQDPAERCGVHHNEWPIALPPDAVGKFPVAGHLPQIPRSARASPMISAWPGVGSMSRRHMEVAAEARRTRASRHLRPGGRKPGQVFTPEVGNPLVDVGLHLRAPVRSWG